MNQDGAYYMNATNEKHQPTTFFWIAELNFSKVHKVTKSTDFDKIFELDIGNVLKMTCTKFEVHTSHHSEDPHENVNFSQKNLKFLGIPRNS